MERTSLFILVMIKVCSPMCPHNDAMLKRWSSPETWPDRRIPVKNSEVKIFRHVLLDISPPDLHSITITPHGKLVWSPDHPIHVRTKYVLIQGKMEIGSESCPYTGNTTITLTGRRGEYNISGYGEKFIGVDYYGTLEIHGERKLSWTKLHRTVNKMKLGSGYLYLHKESENHRKDDWMEGLAAYVLDPTTFKIVNFRLFYLSGKNKAMTGYHVRDVVPFLKSTKPGYFLFMAVQHSLCRDSDLSSIYDEIEIFAYGDIIGTSMIRSIKDETAYVLIVKSGDPTFTTEQRGDISGDARYSEASAHITFWEMRRKVVVQSRIDFMEASESFIDLRISDTYHAYPIIDVIDDVRTWNVGDKILLTSTDYDWSQAEEASIIPCHVCNPGQIRIDLEAHHTHWGEIVNNVDMRGEVAMLTRNIVIQGEMDKKCQSRNGNCDKYNFDTFGGHLLIQPLFTSVRIEGAEIRFMGSQTDIGRYPIHFHFCGDVDNPSSYPTLPFVFNNTIHHSFARCITIHGTNGLRVEDNVCYDCLGHGYFLEEGGEKRTVLDGNLGASTKRADLIPSDTSPTTFWITNPLTYLRNNVAAGSEHTGIWFLFPDEPIGTSKGLGFMANGEARLTPISEVLNNVAHSNHVAGFNIDQKLLSDFSVGSTNDYEPKENPLNTSSSDKEVLVDKITCYKNRMHNVWIRGGLIHVQQASLSDSARSLTFARTGKQAQRLTKSVILGESINIGESITVHGKKTVDRALPIPWDPKHPVMGFAVYDGPVYLEDVWFGSFTHQVDYSVNAIGFQLQNIFPSSPVSSVSGLKFGFDDAIHAGRRIFDGNESIHGFSNLDGDKGATLRDKDGSLTSYPDSQIVKPGPFYVTSECKFRGFWNLAICPHRYGKLSIQVIQPDSRPMSPMMLREDIPHVTETMIGQASTPEFMVILGGSHTYSLHWKGNVPEVFDIHGQGIELGFAVILGVCLPRNAKFDLHSWAPVWKPDITSWTKVESKTELEDDHEGGKYTWNEKTGLLYLKFQSFNKRYENCLDDCNGTCPVVRITILSGDVTDSDCRHRSYHTKGQTSKKTSLKPFKRRIPGYSSSPPKEYGAGSTRRYTYIRMTSGAISTYSRLYLQFHISIIAIIFHKLS